MRTMHVISHTHWDREWYHTFQQFRLKLVQLVDGLLEILEKDPEFKYFMLDGQTIVLEDYLLMRPEQEASLRDHIKKGRIIIGPWHILPDMFLVGPEAHVRNLLEGDRTCRKFGPKMMVGYMPDSFGHIAQMPQILRGFDIKSACLWRGLDEEPAEFWWQAPDGSRVLMAYLRDSYSNGAFLPASETTNSDSLARFSDALTGLGLSLAEHSAANDHLIMLGTDHMQPPVNTSENIDYADEMLSRETRVLHSTLENYLAALQPALENGTLPTVIGELRNSKRMPLLPGVLSTRMWIKQRNSASENLLTKWVEPFSSIAEWQGAGTKTRLQHPAEIIRQTWRLLMENHPHDSICGCSIDQVHDEMKIRFDQVDQIGEELTRQSLEALASQVHTAKPESDASHLGSVIVFNPSGFQRSDVVHAEISLGTHTGGFSLQTESGESLKYETQGLGASELINMHMSPKEFRAAFNSVSDGRVTGLGIQAYSAKRTGSSLLLDITLANAEPDRTVWERAVAETNTYFSDPDLTDFHLLAHTPSLVKIIFSAPHVPGLGWRSFNIIALVKPSSPAQLPALARAMLPLLGRIASLPVGQRLIEKLQREPESKAPHLIENEFFRVELEAEGTLSVLDKRSGIRFNGLNRFTDSGDGGDEYNYSPPAINPQQSARLKHVRVLHGSLQHTLDLELVLKVPLALSSDRKSRSQILVELPIRSRVTLSAGVPRIDIQTHLLNRARDHRLRVHFPTALRVEHARQDGHFEVIQRGIGTPSYDRQTWVEDPRPEVPQRAFTDLAQAGTGLMLANRGLPEVEVLKTGTGTEIALTLLRCVGWLSRDDLQTRRGHAGPGLETPGAQLPGAWDFDYALIPHAAQDNPQQQAYAFETPMRAVAAGLQAGPLPSTGSFLSIQAEGFVLSSLKPAQDGSGWIVRGYNPGPHEIQVSFTPLTPFTHAARVNLAERKLETLQFEAGKVSLTVKSNEVISIWFGE